MLAIKSHEIESYLTGKGLRFRKRGNRADFVACPFCGGGESHDKNTFVVFLDVDGGNYKCMRGSCGASGSFWQLAEHFGDDPKQFYESDGFGKPARVSVQKADQFTPPAKDAKPVFKTQPFILRPFTETAYEYLEGRGFTAAVLDAAAIGCDEVGNICFEYYYQGELCLVKCRVPKVEVGKKTVFAKWKDGLWPLWGIETCNPDRSDSLTITFGEYDRLAAMEAGLSNVVSVPGGDENLDWINLCWYDLEQYKTIILWADNDVSGQKTLPKIAQRLGEHRIRVVKTPFKDANEMLCERLKAIGPERAHDEIYDAVIDAEWYRTADLIRVSDIQHKEQDFSGYSTGFKTLDRALHGFLKGGLTVHTGDSKAGKSTALTQISATSMEQGGTVCAWSGEDDEQSYKYRMDIHLGGIDGTELRTSVAGREYAVLRPEYRNAVKHFLADRCFLLNRRFGVTEANLVESFEIAFKRYGCDVFIVDNLMKMVAAKDTTQIYFRQAQIINALSDFTKTYGVHVHIATHINKAGQDTDPPTKNSVSGAKEITNLADNVLSWWRVPDSEKPRFNMADAVCGVLANRTFGDEPQMNLTYDWRIRRYAESGLDLRKSYFPI